MVWRSEHSQPVKRNLKKAKYRPLLADVDSQTKPWLTFIEYYPHPESLKAPSREQQEFFEEAQIDARTWDEIVTTEADPAVTSILEEVSHDFEHTILNDWDEVRSRNYSLYWKVWMQKRMTSSRARHPWVKPVKVALGTKE